MIDVVIKEKQETTTFRVKYALIKTSSFIGPCWEIVGDPIENAPEAYAKLKLKPVGEYIIIPIYVIP
jgi:hypothetical protein